MASIDAELGVLGKGRFTRAFSGVEPRKMRELHVSYVPHGNPFFVIFDNLLVWNNSKLTSINAKFMSINAKFTSTHVN